MKMRGCVVSLSFTFPHPPEEKKKEQKKKLRWNVGLWGEPIFWIGTGLVKEKLSQTIALLFRN